MMVGEVGLHGSGNAKKKKSEVVSKQAGQISRKDNEASPALRSQA